MEEENIVDDLLLALRRNWKFPAVVHFCRVFEGVLSLSQFSSDQLERALISPGEHPVFLSELVSRLLYPGRKLSQNPEAWPTWEPSLQKKVKTNWNLVLQNDPLVGRHFADLSSSEKLDVLYLLTEVALQNSALLRDTIRNTVEDPYLTADSVRCLPIGENGEGEKYFLFSLRYEDCRLYKQSLIKEKDSVEEAMAMSDIDPPTWNTVTTSLRELQDFVVDVRRSKNPSEKKLYKYLAGILPEFERTERHRKKVEEKAAAREQTPLLKRSSRLQEQAKRKEIQEKGGLVEDKELSNGENSEVVAGEDDPTLDLGISREERMKLRNRRRELAEKGLRRVLTGKKRLLEYDGLTPLGPSIKCLAKKRSQEVRPPRQINKLVSIIWEKFRKSLHHRKQFELHFEAAKKRRLTYFHNRLDFAHRSKPPIYAQRKSLEETGLSGLRLGNEHMSQDVQRPYSPQRSVMLNYMQKQRPPMHSYAIPAPLRMQPPVQSTSDSRQSLVPMLQEHLMTLDQPTRESVMELSPPIQQTYLIGSLKRKQELDQKFASAEHESKSHIQSFLNQGCGNLVQQSREPIRSPSAHYHYPPRSVLSAASGGGLPRPFVSNTREFIPSLPDRQQQQTPQMLSHHMATIPGVNPSFRNVRPTLVANQLNPSLVQLPASLESAVKNSWNMKLPTVVGGHTETPRLAVAQPIYPHQDHQIPTSVPLLFENGASWQHSPPYHRRHVSADPNNPATANSRLQGLFLNSKRSVRRSNDTQ